MSPEFRLLPDQATNLAGRVDELYWFLMGVSLFFTALIFVLIVTFSIKYRQGAAIDRVKRGGHREKMLLEIAWTAIPLAIVMVSFTWGADLFLEAYRPRENPLHVDIVGKQWMWRIQHEEGHREIDHLHVPVGESVKLTMISEDVIHSFYIPAFRIKMDVLPGRYTNLWFTPTTPGEYHLFCAEYCGTSHSRMRGTVTVMDSADYAAWIAADQEIREELGSLSGRRLFEKYQCGNCHDTGRAPNLLGIYGRRVPLEGGGTAVADEQYIRESIVNPAVKVVAGYDPLMPTFQDRISEAEILQLIRYLRSHQRTGAPDETAPDETEPGQPGPDQLREAERAGPPEAEE